MGRNEPIDQIKIAVLEGRLSMIHAELKEEKEERKKLDTVIFQKLDELSKNQETLGKQIVRLGATAVGAIAVVEIAMKFFGKG